MMNAKHTLFILLLLAFYPLLSEATSFSRMPVSAGFPQTNITDIAQDKFGDIWINSLDEGVFRYDGTRVQKIAGDIRPQGLCADEEGRVFVGTFITTYLYEESRGLTVFSSTEGFRKAKKTPEGDIFFLTTSSVNLLRAGTDSLITVFRIDEPLLRSIEYQNGNIFVGGTKGAFFKIDADSFESEQIEAFSENILCMAAQNDSLLWISNYGQGVSCFNLSSRKVEKTIGKREGMSSSFVQSMSFENDSTLWLGTYEGMNVLNLQDFNISVSRYHFFDDNSLSHNSVKVLFRDRQGGMWAGTFFGGVCYYHKARNRFRVFREGIGEEYLNDSVVSCICEGLDGNLWIGTNNGGINEYDKKTDAFKYYRFNSKTNQSNDVKAFLFMPDNRYVYVGLFRGGLNLLDRRTGDIRHLTSPDNVITIDLLDKDHLLLNSYDETYSYCISEDKYYKIGKNISSIPRFVESIIIPGVKIASKLTDNNGNSWYGTNSGLYKLNEADSSIVHFSTADGLSCDYFNPGAACLAYDGTIYFGGVGGVTYFNPYKFLEEEPCPSPVLRSIVVNENQKLDMTVPIRLKHSQNRITFNFSVPDYVSVGSNVFEYKLDGFEKEWNSSAKRNSAYYPNLPPGIYHFRLRVSRGNSDWVESYVSTKVKIYHPWYSSAIGILTEILLLCLIVFLTISSISRRKDMEHALAISQMEEKYQHDISKLKVLKLVNTKLRIDQKPQPLIEDLSRQNELFITEAMSIVEANICNEDFSTEMLAKKLAMSRASLHIRIKEATGQSALEFIQKIRFSEACRLLEEGKLTISEVGYKIGIKSPSYFSSSFKRVVGCLPKEYIERQNLKRLDKI